LEKDPADRPRSAQEAEDALDEIVSHLLGPRWRREARLVDEPQAAPPVPTPDLETPSTDGFETFRPRADELPEPTPPEPAPPPIPEPEPPTPPPPPEPAPPAPEPVEEPLPPAAEETI